jgi:hypothetical protein
VSIEMRRCRICKRPLDMLKEHYFIKNGSGEVSHIYHMEAIKSHLVTNRVNKNAPYYKYLEVTEGE